MAELNAVGKFLERIYPKHGTLQVDEEGTLYTIITDAESDGFMCKFNYDECVEIDTESYSYITLDAHTLILLADLIERAEKIYKDCMKKEENIGKKVRKCNIGRGKTNGKPFKSGLNENTVKDVIIHPTLIIPAYTFIEDDSYVECRRCTVVG